MTEPGSPPPDPYQIPKGSDVVPGETPPPGHEPPPLGYGGGDQPPGGGESGGGDQPPGGGESGGGDQPPPDRGTAPRGPWYDRVLFSSRSQGSAFAYRPHEVLTTKGREALDIATDLYPDAEIAEAETIGRFTRLTGVPDPLAVIRELQLAGIIAQPNHVFFSHSIFPNPLNPTPLNPTPLNPTPLNPTPLNPTPLNPTPLNPTPLNPTPLNPTDYDKVVSSRKIHGPKTSSARPAPEDEATESIAKRLRHPPTDASPHVIVLDTGLAEDQFLPAALKGVTTIKAASPADLDHPDDNRDDLLDPVAGHGTFIAGLIGQIAPGTRITVHRVLATFGDTSEWAVIKRLRSLNFPKPHRTLLSLSFGGYVLDHPYALAAAIRSIRAKGVTVVASAGNDASWRPTFPAALPGVISVGAIGPNGPAYFTNYGGWVSACAPGVDVLSTFFDDFNGRIPVGTDGIDPDHFDGWARWSGTSFSTPIVVGNLARMMMSGASAEEAIERIIDEESLMRIRYLGTVVDTM